jgi:ribonuclease E
VAPAAPEAPRVVTSTRRRTARRPAGPPSPLNDVAPRAGAGTEAGPSAEPVDVPVEPTGDDVDGEGPDGDGIEGVDEDGFSLSHVPVKRKGSRKR